ncbi:Rpn family recombination-promoting nuclease/putative transposase [Brevibacillus invocatus]|nr:Rpn family recombination-promoting nuclease/putative transposase [Brevibacillus invocatus]MCM3431160.1 Rpn family recombination-promoting nuclease/putative transposase [Brevibacillus invocatus]
MEKRSLYYWAKMYEGQLAEGEPYRNLKKTVTYLPSKSYHSVFRLREDAEKFILTDNLEIHFLELPKLGFEQQKTSDLLVKWLLFLKAESETKLEELAMSEPTIRKAINVLEFLSQDKEARKLYEMREMVQTMDAGSFCVAKKPRGAVVHAFPERTDQEYAVTTTNP